MRTTGWRTRRPQGQHMDLKLITTMGTCEQEAVPNWGVMSTSRAVHSFDY